MKKIVGLALTAVLFLLTTSHTNKKLDEGMFLLSDLKNLDLQKIGLRISPEELYNPNGTSLIDAIVRVGGCTGSFVSGEGLIVTNHHCAFGYVQAISTKENNYIKQGFLAANRAAEVPAKGLVCKITASYEDVSKQVLNGTDELMDPSVRLEIIRRNLRAITEAENKANKDLQCEISEMFTGRTYILFRYRLLKDVRLVYVPARSIGEYGGEIDNWVWPRHSGDFAFLRAYVAPDGTASEYNEKNVPFLPKKHLRVNPAGVKENDFVFILGYPGRTFRHQPAAFYKYHEGYVLNYISGLYDFQIESMSKLSRGNESLEIKYAGRMKSLANVTKNYKGKLQGFRRAGLTASKEKDEAALQAFILADPALKKRYEDVIPGINAIYADILKGAPRNLWFQQVYQVCPSLSFASTLVVARQAYNSLNESERKAYVEANKLKWKAALSRFETNHDPALEGLLFDRMMQDARGFNASNRIQWLTTLEAAKGQPVKNWPAFIGKSRLTRFEDLEKLYESDPEKWMKLKDPLLDLVEQLNAEALVDDSIKRNQDTRLNLLMAKYIDMKSLWKSKEFVPDANSTLRFTYGYIRGYEPNDAVYNAPITTLKGVIEKEDGKDFELLEVIRDLYAKRDFGPFEAAELHDLPVNILYNLDTTGGNSGSPVMNAKGELIGVNFDRAYTATINDYAWNESYSRSVAVDIRYVLWILQKVAHADHVVKELGG